MSSTAYPMFCGLCQTSCPGIGVRYPNKICNGCNRHYELCGQCFVTWAAVEGWLCHLCKRATELPVEWWRVKGKDGYELKFKTKPEVLSYLKQGEPVLCVKSYYRALNKLQKACYWNEAYFPFYKDGPNSLKVWLSQNPPE